VEGDYAALFEAGPELSAGVGNLVFTGDGRSGYAADAEGSRLRAAERSLSRHPNLALWPLPRHAIRRGARAADGTDAALLEAFGESTRADEALLRFDNFSPACRRASSSFRCSATIPPCSRPDGQHHGCAPRLAEIIAAARMSSTACSILHCSPNCQTRTYLSASGWRHFLTATAPMKRYSTACASSRPSRSFLIGVRLLAGSIDAARAGRAFSDLADLTIGAALDAVMEEFAQRHGNIPGGRIALLGMGKLGSRELTAGSDVDLILLYDHDETRRNRMAQKPLDRHRTTSPA
jgi:glutamate-ammonia-ligase adenylyltransferase